MPDIKSMTMTFRLKPATKEGLRIISGRESRSIANSIEWLVKGYFESRSMPWPPEAENPPSAGAPKKRNKGTSNA